MSWYNPSWAPWNDEDEKKPPVKRERSASRTQQPSAPPGHPQTPALQPWAGAPGNVPPRQPAARAVAPESTGVGLIDWFLGRGEHYKEPTTVHMPTMSLGASAARGHPATPTTTASQARAQEAARTQAVEGPPKPSAAAAAAKRQQDLLASSPTNQLLIRSGWTVPREEMTAASTAGLDMSKAIDLTGYNYTVSDAEWKDIQNTYGGTKNYGTGVVWREGQKIPSIASEVTRAAPMTWEAYDALTDEQRRAVDYNTLLVEARQQDLSQSYYLDEGAQKDYSALQKKLFGDTGGSKKIAPNTLKLLGDLGMSAKGQDLDEFLSLDRAITTDELANFSFATGGAPAPVQTDIPVMSAPGSAPVPAQSNYGLVRGRENQALVETALIRNAGTYIDELMKDPGRSLGDLTTTLRSEFSGLRPSTPVIGYGLEGEFEPGTPQFNQNNFWKTAYDFVSNKENVDPSSYWTQAQSHNFTDSDHRELFDYLTTRAANEPGGRTPEEIRAFLEGG